MTTAAITDPKLNQASGQNRPSIPNGVLGMIIFIVTETMFFLGFISAFSIVKSTAVSWPPPDQPRLPWEATALNSLALLASGLLIFLANRQFKAMNHDKAKKLFLFSFALGTFFICYQGYEWTKLVGYGLTMQSSQYGSFFYLIIGAHALHAIAALVLMARLALKSAGKTMPSESFFTVQVFWYFVVGIWPVLYLLVYDPVKEILGGT
jgi:cytochrome c oxidase subunit III